ncbi:MAG: hypothetical protein HYX64_02605 [Gammaproteobacteria bacterium]|nr:hypothetical protein [Gammaproteobacteria bacterium]
MTGPAMLKEFEDNWVTAMGAWFPGERVVLRGKDVLSDLGRRPWMEYLVYAITGRESPELARLIEGIWAISCSYPDPRLWNNRVAALAGTSRSTGVLAIASAVSVTEATLYGLRPIKRAMDFFYRADSKLKQGQSLEEVIRTELKSFRVVSGYGRPIAETDERISPLLRFAKTLGKGNGPYVKLALQVHDYLKNSRYKNQINIAALAAAILADEGLSPEDLYNLATLAFVAGMFPCYIDARQKPEGALYPLRTTRINYRGAETRHWG